MRLGATKTGATTTYNGLGDQLYDLGGARPTLDLNFASNGSLVDSVTGKTLVTHTRQSNATYVDGDGIIKDAVTNIVFDSENLSASSWDKNGSCTVTSGQVSPNGDSSAYLVQNATVLGDSSGNDNLRKNQGTNSSFGSLAAGAYTISGYVKGNGATTQFTPRIRLSASSVDSQVAVNTSSSWQRFTVTVTATVTSDLRMIFAADSSDGFYLWGLQVEQSSTAGEYVKTTSTINSAPRFDHNPTTGESLGLLVEESRTNLVTDSEDTTEWTVNGDVNITANNATAPDNSTTADKLENVSNPFDGPWIVVSISTSTTYTVSGFIKAVDQPRSRLGVIHSVDAWFGYVDTDWDASGTPSTQGSSGASNITYENYGNNWYRVSFNFTSPASISSGETRFMLQPDRTNTQQSIYFWGAQLEAGSFPTSYIRTEGSTVTRSADVASITGTNFSSWYNQTEGTVFADTEKPSLANTVVTSISDGTSSNRIELRSSAGGVAQVRFEIVESGSAGYSRTFNVDAAYKKLAFAYAENNSHGVANGVLDTTDTSVAIPTVDNLYFGNNLFLTNQRPGHIKRLTYWPTRLSNDTLQTITR